MYFLLVFLYIFFKFVVSVHLHGPLYMRL